MYTFIAFIFLHAFLLITSFIFRIHYVHRWPTNKQTNKQTNKPTNELTVYTDQSLS